MHFEFLVEGTGDKTALSILLPKIIGEYNAPHTWIIHGHRGVGIIPKDIMAKPSSNDASLLGTLPAKLRAYEKSAFPGPICILLDLDDKGKEPFLRELSNLKAEIAPSIDAFYCVAIEELEAWFLGDSQAILKAYPQAKMNCIAGYTQDSICSTWELLRDIIDPNLKNVPKRDFRILEMKRQWAAKICKHMDVNQNSSPSFNYFKNEVVYRLESINFEY